MIFAIDHIVFATTRSQSYELRDRLVIAGFHSEAFSLSFPEIGATSESVSFAGGGFVEFVARNDEALAPAIWFAEIPRVIGLGFGSDDFDVDTSWSAHSGAWAMDEDHVLPDGTRLNIHAAGPHPHFSDFFVFVMDRRDGRLQFPERTGGPRLRQLSFTGAAAELWRGRLVDWLRLTERSGSLYVGDVELVFEHRSRQEIRVMPIFDGASQSGLIPLSEGSIELQAAGGSATYSERKMDKGR